MKKGTFTSIGSWLKATTTVSILMLALVACKKEDTPKAPVLPGNYTQKNLVANTMAYNAGRIDTMLRDAWGIAFSAGGTPWVSSTGGRVSVVYTSEGAQARTPVHIPSPGGPFDGAFGGQPTGQVFYGGTTDFILPNNAPARFIFVGVDGILSAWQSGNTAWRLVNNSATSAYTGLAIGSSAGANYLYAADFRANKITVWNRTFQPVNMTFKDPGLPSGYAPFNIQAIGDKLYVTYAKVGPMGYDEPGKGNGYVTIFNTDGSFFKRFASRGPLNSPWGVAMAPTTFVDDDPKVGGTVPGAILVGNFGDGRILAYSPGGDFLGALRSNGKEIVIDGLWAISFPPATATTVDQGRLYFAAGPNKGVDGLFGYLTKATNL